MTKLTEELKTGARIYQHYRLYQALYLSFADIPAKFRDADIATTLWFNAIIDIRTLVTVPKTKGYISTLGALFWET